MCNHSRIYSVRYDADRKLFRIRSDGIWVLENCVFTSHGNFMMHVRMLNLQGIRFLTQTPYAPGLATLGLKLVH